MTLAGVAPRKYFPVQLLIRKFYIHSRMALRASVDHQPTGLEDLQTKLDETDMYIPDHVSQADTQVLPHHTVHTHLLIVDSVI